LVCCWGGLKLLLLHLYRFKPRSNIGVMAYVIVKCSVVALGYREHNAIKYNISALLACEFEDKSLDSGLECMLA